MAKSKEQPKEQQQQEAKQQPQQQQPKQQQPKEQPKQQPKKTRPKAPSVKRITMEYFMKFDPKPRRKSWVKEALEIAVKEPIMVGNLSRGQIMALINQIDKHNMTSEFKIVYKYSVKQGIVLLAPKKLLHQIEGERK